MAPPLKRPSGCAATTVPVALEPSGITTVPPTSTGRATVAEKLSPDWLILDPNCCAVRTVITVPAGIVIGVASAAARVLRVGEGAAAVLDALEVSPPEPGVAVAAG